MKSDWKVEKSTLRLRPDGAEVKALLSFSVLQIISSK